MPLRDGIDQGLFEINASSGVTSRSKARRISRTQRCRRDNRYEVQVLAQCNSQSLSAKIILFRSWASRTRPCLLMGTASATGNNNRGQFGNDSNVSSLSFVETISHGVAEVSGGQGFAFGTENRRITVGHGKELRMGKSGTVPLRIAGHRP